MTATTAKGETFNFCPICFHEENDRIVGVKLGVDGQVYCLNNHKLTGANNFFVEESTVRRGKKDEI